MRGLSLAAALVVAACGGGGGARPVTTTPVAAGQEASCETPAAVAGHAPSHDRKTTVIMQTVCCPSDVPEATSAYNAAIDAEEARDLAAAMDGYRRAIELDPTFCDAMDNLGLIYRASGDLDRAVELYAQSLKIVPRNPVALQNMGVAKVLAGKVDEAVPYYEKLIVVDPANPEGPYGLGQVYRRLGRVDDAIAAFTQAHARYERMGSPLIAHTHYLLGVLFAEKRDLPRAREHLQRAVDLGMEEAAEALAGLPTE